MSFWSVSLLGKSLTITKEMGQLARQGFDRRLLLDLINSLLTVGFFLLILTVYLSRPRAVDSARGFWERGFPMLIFVAGVAGVSTLQVLPMRACFDLPLTGVVVATVGIGVCLWALWHLKSSFSIMAEARTPVMSGPYRFVRHPLYLGEALTMLGLCLKIGTATAVVFWAGVNALQLLRARVEEEKLSSQFLDYRAYRERTRFILPGVY